MATAPEPPGDNPWAHRSGPTVVAFGFDVLDRVPAILRPRLEQLLADPDG